VLVEPELDSSVVFDFGLNINRNFSYWFSTLKKVVFNHQCFQA